MFILKKSIFKTILFLTIVTTVLSSCLKQDSEPVQISGLNIVQASPGPDVFDVFIGNRKANTEDFTYGAKIGYLNVIPGSRSFTLTKKDNASIMLSGELSIDKQEGYSLFVIDVPTSMKLLLLKDDLKKPATGKATIRFVNLSLNAPAQNLAIDGMPNDIADNRQFKDYTEFQSIDPGNTVNFTLKNKASGAT
ncbi:MAG: DUF4397 domain-containing protein, partial [Pedobacter sp.]